MSNLFFNYYEKILEQHKLYGLETSIAEYATLINFNTLENYDNKLHLLHAMKQILIDININNNYQDTCLFFNQLKDWECKLLLLARNHFLSTLSLKQLLDIENSEMKLLIMEKNIIANKDNIKWRLRIKKKTSYNL